MLETNTTTSGTGMEVHSRSALCRARAPRAQVLRSVSGLTAGVTPSRRGSFLVLVVGVLALLSVIAVLYATLGMGDRNRAAAVIKKHELDTYPQDVRDYIAQIIADDALDSIGELRPGSTTGSFSYSRESWDYPFTNWQARNDAGGALPNQPLFSPTGAPRVKGNGQVVGGPPAQWIPSDPFLADTEPVFMDVDQSLRGGIALADLYKQRRDWAHISNIAPDGRFVNLALLRNNFDIPSRSLTVGLTIPGLPASTVVPGTTIPLSPHTPAHFDSRQIGGFRPMFDSTLLAPSDPRAISNQWADADGDGFADSRLAELVDASGPAEFAVVPRDPNLRIFVASRIIDLSGLVNVNTASDMMAAPDTLRPIGSSPGEIDLRQLLMLVDQADRQYTSPATAPGGTTFYDGIPFDPARDPSGVQNYYNYTPGTATNVGGFAYQAAKVSLAAGTPIPPAEALGFDPDFGYFGPYMTGPIVPVVSGAGEFSFAAQYGLTGVQERQDWDLDNPLAGAPRTGAQARYQAYAKRFASQQANFVVSSGGATPVFRADNLGLFGNEDLLELLTYRGVNDPAVRSTLEMVLGGRGYDQPNNAAIPNFSPLRDNRLLALERPQTLTAPASDQTQWEQHMLLRAVDVRQRLTTVSGARETRLATNITAPQRLGESEVRIDPVGLLARTGSISRFYQPTPPIPAPGHPTDDAFSALFAGYLKSLAPYLNDNEPGTGNNAAWNSAGAATLSYGHQGAEFAFITSAFMAMNMADKFDLDSVPQARTLLINADFRLDLNNNTPDVATSRPMFPYWNSSGGAADSLVPNATIGDVTDPAILLAAAPDSVFQAIDSRGDIYNSPAINVFGVEAQPFITASTVFTVYTDAPVSAGGDLEANSEVTIRGDIDPSNSDFVMRVFAVQLTNPFNAAIQLGAQELGAFDAVKNPRGMDLQLLDVGDPGFPAITKLKDYFYLEFAGRQYALTRLVEKRVGNPGTEPHEPDGTLGAYTNITEDGLDVVAKPIIIPPGESVVVYALSQVPRVILERMARVGTPGFMDATVADPSSGATYSIPRNQSPYEFHKLIRKHIADRGLGIGRPTTISAVNDGTYDQDGVYWIPEMHSPRIPAPGNRKVGAIGMSIGAPTTTGANFTRFAAFNANEDNFSDIIQDGATNASADLQSVKLWRAIRTGIDDSNNPNFTTNASTDEFVRVVTPNPALPTQAWNVDSPYTQPANTSLFVDNDRYNDLLVDRMRLPVSTAPRRNANFNPNTRLRNGINRVAGTLCNIPGPLPGDPTTPGDDTGYTITLWDSVHRPADRQGGVTGAIKSGSLPAYCIERKLSGDPTGSEFWNVYIPDDVPGQALRIEQFQNSGSGAGGANVEFDNWFNDPNEFDTSGPDVVIAALGEAPSLRAPDAATLNAIDQTWRFNTTGPTAVEKPYLEEDRPELIINNDRYSPLPLVFDPGQCFLRSTDLLTALPVGTIHDPLATLPPNWSGAGMSLDDVAWTTLSESFCLALGYETAPYPDATCAVRAMYPTRPVTTDLYYRNYDHGQLKLDEFVPFFDADGNGQLDTATEFRRGAQTPVAWNVLDTFLSFRSTPDSFKPGTINVNTASQDVLAAVPLLAPTTLTSDGFLRGAARSPWWWTIAPTDPLNNPNATTETSASDITATLAAVRDKSVGFFRPPSVPAALGGQTYVGFDEGAPINQYNNYAGRSARTGILDIGELPGFRTPGSILMARWRDTSSPAAEAATAASPSNIDFLARDTRAGAPADSSFRGVSSGLTQNWDTASNSWKTTPNLQGNDYQEKLAIAAGALGSISTRSDLYAAWFVVQGYTKDDATNLGPNDPMVPSVKRRFVMVVDRSNVRQLGDKPKILFFKEVPAD